MAKESMKAREVKEKKLVAKYAEKRKSFKRSWRFRGLQKLPKNASPVRMHNRCKLTGRPRGYMRQFGISRVTFREMANNGLIIGVKKPGGNLITILVFQQRVVSLPTFSLNQLSVRYKIEF